jgi:hypothetical protein
LAYNIVPDDGKSERSRTTRLGSLLAQRINATFEVDSYEHGYLKIIWAEAERAAGRADQGYALKQIEKSGDQVREVREPAKNAEKAAKTKGNFFPNLEPDATSQFSEVREAQVAENKGESQPSRTSRTLKGDFADGEIEIEAEDVE